MRSKRAPKKILLPDPKFNNLTISKFVNYVMERGKKTVAQGIVYDTFEMISRQTKKDPLDVFDLAIRNVTPLLEVKSRRIGGANYQIPMEVRGDRKMYLAMNWIIDAAKAKKGKPMSERLAEEITAAAENQGDAINKNDDVLRMAEANRAFAHFAYGYEI